MKATTITGVRKVCLRIEIVGVEKVLPADKRYIFTSRARRQAFANQGGMLDVGKFHNIAHERYDVTHVVLISLDIDLF